MTEPLTRAELHDCLTAPATYATGDVLVGAEMWDSLKATFYAMEESDDWSQGRVGVRLVRYMLSHHDFSATLETDDPEAYGLYMVIVGSEEPKMVPAFPPLVPVCDSCGQVDRSLVRIRLEARAEQLRNALGVDLNTLSEALQLMAAL